MHKTPDQIKAEIKEKVVFSVKAEPCGFSLEQAFSFTTTGVDYNEHMAFIQENAEANPWLWCNAIVTAQYKDLKGYSYLTSCNYDSQDQFMAGEYYKEMQEEALDQLVIEIIAVIEQVVEFV